MTVIETQDLIMLAQMLIYLLNQIIQVKYSLFNVD